MIAAAGNIALGAARYGLRKYGARAATTAAAAGLGYAGYRASGKWKSKARGVTVRKIDKNATPRYRPARRQFIDGSENQPANEGAQGGYNQWDESRMKTGRKAVMATVASTLLKQNLDTGVTCFKNISQFNGANGSVFCGHLLDASANKRYLPLYLFDLTHLAEAGQPAAHRLCMETTGADDGKCSWISIPGKDFQNVDSYVPYWHYASTNFPTTAWNNRLHFGSTIIKLNLWGIKTRPVKWIIRLVKFSGDDYTPVADDGLTVTTVTSQLGNAFWQPQVKRLVGNPIADQPTALSRCMKILGTRVVHIGPTVTTESDDRPHIHTLTWKHDINKVVSMRKYQSVSNDDVNVVNPNISTSDNNSTHLTADFTPFSKDRVYLMVSCQVFNEVVSPTVRDSSNSPSFDYNLKTTVRCIQ